jgi:hypothetical protein
VEESGISGLAVRLVTQLRPAVVQITFDASALHKSMSLRRQSTMGWKTSEGAVDRIEMTRDAMMEFDGVANPTLPMLNVTCPMRVRSSI